MIDVLLETTGETVSRVSATVSFKVFMLSPEFKLMPSPKYELAIDPYEWFAGSSVRSSRIDFSIFSSFPSRILHFSNLSSETVEKIKLKISLLIS